jgi:hypothetical protein
MYELLFKNDEDEYYRFGEKAYSSQNEKCVNELFEVSLQTGSKFTPCLLSILYFFKYENEILDDDIE